MRNLALTTVVSLFVLATAVSAEPTRTGNATLTVVASHRAPYRRWSAIVVHHSASGAGNAATLDAYHRTRFPRGLAYHFVIGNGRGLEDGGIEAGGRWIHQQPGAHVVSTLRDPTSGQLWDEVAIGICLIGNFEESRPSTRQVAALERLTHTLQQRFRIASSRVIGHGDVNGAHTACPGRRLEDRLSAVVLPPHR